jgi:hypothetical protein
MKAKQINLITILFLLMTSCYLLPPRWVSRELRKHQPAKECYHLSKKPFIYKDFIDTTCIYFHEGIYVTTNSRGQILAEEHKKYAFIRFSGYGVAFVRSGMLAPPLSFDVNALVRGQFCYYSIINPNVLKMEVYNHNTKMFEYRYGKIQSNGDILFFKEKGRPWLTYTSEVDLLYKKTPAEIYRPIVFPTD